jgi:UDP-N-acetylglucosamine acyltransferase
MSGGAVEAAEGTRHETAIIHSAAQLAESVAVGPYAIIGPGVEVGDRTVIDSHVLIEKDTRVAAGCHICKGAVLGTDPQDLKYEGEPSTLEIGSGTTIREYATVNRGTSAAGATRVGDDCLLMAYSHVAHDCQIGDHVILANSVNMGGHVEIDDWAIVGGLTAIHQFVHIGVHSFVGGGSRLPQDVVPYTMVAGNPCAAFGLNLVGLRRRGFPRETLKALRDAYRLVFQSQINIGQALDELEARSGLPREVGHMVSFIRASERGITT